MVISSKFLDALTPSSIRSITAKIRDKAKDGIQVVSFAGGLPSKEFFPLEDLRRITDRVFDEEGGEAIQYAASDGYDPLRQYLVEFMKRYQVNNIDYKNILITSGAQQGLAYLSKGMIEPGSVVIVENPSYPGALDVTASIFGKADANAKVEDIALGIVHMVLQTIGQGAVFASLNGDIKNIVLIGNLTRLPQCPDIFPRLEEMCDVHFKIPEYAEYRTAIGAALCYIRNREYKDIFCGKC